MFQAIRDYRVRHNISIAMKRNRLGHGEHFQITFNHIGEFCFHLTKLCGFFSKDNVKAYFTKKSSNGKKAEIVLTNDKPATIEYNFKKSKMTIKLFYEVKNKYGLICGH